MAIIKQQITFFNDEVGRVLDGAKIFSYEKDDENTQKALYLDEDQLIIAPYPLEATARGIFPQVYGAGDYLFVYTDKNEVEFDRRDVAAGTSTTGSSTPTFNNVADLQAGITYGGLFVELVEGDICKTVGETEPRDAVSSDWIIRASDVTVEDFKYFELDNGLVAERLNNFYSGMGVTLSDADDAEEQNTYLITGSTANIPPIEANIYNYSPVTLTTTSNGTDKTQMIDYSDSSGSFQEFKRRGKGTFTDRWFQSGQSMSSDLFAGTAYSDIFSSDYYGLFFPNSMTENPFGAETIHQRFWRPDAGLHTLGWSVDDFIIGTSDSINYHSMKDRVARMRYDSAGAVVASFSANSNEDTLPAANKTGTGVYEIDVSGLTAAANNPIPQVTAENTSAVFAVVSFSGDDLIIKTFTDAGVAIDSAFFLTFSWRF